jgi:hypothetical protein
VDKALKELVDHRFIADPGPGEHPFPEEDNKWHLGYGVPGYSSEGNFQEVARTGMGDRDADHPMEVNQVYENLGNRIVLQNPSTDCGNTGPASTNACAFTSRSAVSEDDHHVRYSFRNWGGRCDIWLRVMLYPKITAWKWGDLTPWSSGSPFIVIVPDGVSTPVVFGKLEGRNIFFLPSDPLSETDKEHFELLDSRPVPGLGIVYRFKTKD